MWQVIEQALSFVIEVWQLQSLTPQQPFNVDRAFN